MAIARAVVMGPSLLLADEPTGNLDTAAGAEIVKLLEGMNARGLTLVVVTHDPAIGRRARHRLRLVDGAIDREERDVRGGGDGGGGLVTARDLVAFSVRALRGHRLRTGLSLAGVAIGVASVVLLTSLGEGARLYVTGEFANLGTNLLIVLPGKTETSGVTPFVTGAPHDLTLDDAEALSPGACAPCGASRRCRAARPRRPGRAPARRDRGRHDRRLSRGAQPGDRRPGASCRREKRPASSASASIGSTVRRELFGAENPLGEWLRLGDERFRIIGVLAPRGMSIGMDMDDMVYVPVGRAMKMFNQSGLFRLLIEVAVARRDRGRRGGRAARARWSATTAKTTSRC